jgi:hypothetical protein
MQVSNCELSPFYLQSDHQQQQHMQRQDFLDDFDYDFFQREPYCKTSSGGLDTFGGKIETQIERFHGFFSRC